MICLPSFYKNTLSKCESWYRESTASARFACARRFSFGADGRWCGFRGRPTPGMPPLLFPGTAPAAPVSMPASGWYTRFFLRSPVHKSYEQ